MPLFCILTCRHFIFVCGQIYQVFRLYFFLVFCASSSAKLSLLVSQPCVLIKSTSSPRKLCWGREAAGTPDHCLPPAQCKWGLAELWACPCARMLSHWVLSDTLWPNGLYPARLLRPQDSPGKNTGAGCHFLLQGILPTQGSNLLFCESCIGWQVLYHQCHLGNFPPPCYPMRSTQTSFSGHSQWHFLGSGLRNVSPKTVLL